MAQKICPQPADTNYVNDARLDPEEDAELRRLHMLRGFGMVAGSITSRYDALRGRDRRRDVREPEDASMAAPVAKSLWGEDDKSAKAATTKTAAETTAARTGLAPQRVVSRHP